MRALFSSTVRYSFQNFCSHSLLCLQLTNLPAKWYVYRCRCRRSLFSNDECTVYRYLLSTWFNTLTMNFVFCTTIPGRTIVRELFGMNLAHAMYACEMATEFSVRINLRCSLENVEILSKDGNSLDGKLISNLDLTNEVRCIFELRMHQYTLHGPSGGIKTQKCPKKTKIQNSLHLKKMKWFFFNPVILCDPKRFWMNWNYSKWKFHFFFQLNASTFQYSKQKTHN